MSHSPAWITCPSLNYCGQWWARPGRLTLDSRVESEPVVGLRVERDAFPRKFGVPVAEGRREGC